MLRYERKPYTRSLCGEVKYFKNEKRNSLIHLFGYRCNIVWTSLNRTVSLSTVGHLAACLASFLFTYFPIFTCVICSVGRLACKLYLNMRREAAAVKIQKHVRRHESRKSYNKLHASVLTLQTALRAIAARKDFNYRKQTKASTIIQVIVDSCKIGPSA